MDTDPALSPEQLRTLEESTERAKGIMVEDTAQLIAELKNRGLL